MPYTRRRLLARAARVSGAAVAASALPPAAAFARPLQPDDRGRAVAAAEAARPAAARGGLPRTSPTRSVRRLDRTWVEEERAYSAGGRVIDVIYNAALLTIHGVAAERGYDGPSRNDARARLIAARLCESPPFFSGTTLPNPDKMFHTPGWLGDLGTFDSPMDKAIDPKVAEGLTAAWRARAVLGLGPELEGRIVAAVDAVARGPFFRYPYVRLNQINWNAELYAHAATLTGNGELLVDDYRRHMRRFVAGVRRPLEVGGAHNLSPSYRFQYQSDSAGSRKNIDSAEYANITLHFVSWYEQALRAGMRPLPAADMRILRAWAARVQFGYWMHNGMLSWDSGLGFKRWMKAKTWAYALQGPMAIASSPRFWLDPQPGRVGQVRLRPRAVAVRAPLRAARPAPPPVGAPLRRRPRVPGHRQPAHLRRPHGRERGARDRPRARRDGRRGAAAVLLLRRRHRPPEREHAPLLRGDRGRQPRRVSLRRDRARAAVRLAGRSDRRRRRAAAGQLRRRPAPPGPQPRARDAGRAGGRRGRARALPARARDPHPPLPGAPGRGAVRPPRGGRPRRARRRRGHGPPPLHAGVRREHLDRDARPPAAARRGAVPELGRRRRADHRRARGRHDGRAAPSGRGERGGGALLPPRRPARRLRPRARGRRPGERPPRRPPGRRRPGPARRSRSQLPGTRLRARIAPAAAPTAPRRSRACWALERRHVRRREGAPRRVARRRVST